MPSPGPLVLTVGHSDHPMSAFVMLLRSAGIDLVVDVRSVPWSRRHPQFRRETLAARLDAESIGYRFLGDLLGARRTEPDAFDEDGTASYERVARLPTFNRGIDLVLESAAAHRPALLCAEREPLDCHRAVLVAPRLADRGAAVAHLLADGRVEPLANAETRMLALVGLPAHDLFLDRDALVAEAYRRLGAQLAWRRTPESEGSAP